MIEIVLTPAQVRLVEQSRERIVFKDGAGRVLGRLSDRADVDEAPQLTAAEAELIAERMRTLPSDLSTLPTTAEVLRRIKSQVRS